MKKLVEEIARRIRESVASSVSALQGPKPELRILFHGPPMHYLRPVFKLLADEGGIHAQLPSGEQVLFPVLLQVDRLAEGLANPRIGESGECVGDHLLTLRNSSRPSFVALVPPGKHTVLSVTSASNDFGLTAEHNSGSATIDAWLADDFIQALLVHSLDAAGLRNEARDGARQLVEHSVRAADEMDHHAATRQRAWDVLARVASIPPASDSPGRYVSLACGVPPTDDGTVQAEEQMKCVGKLAHVVADEAFRPGIERLKERLVDEADLSALDAFLAHILAVCELQSAFERMPQFFYAPSQSDALLEPPAWWLHLTVERWTDILEEDKQPEGSLRIDCLNSLIPRTQGLDALVLGRAEFAVSLPEAAAGNVSAVVLRQVGGPAGRETWNVALPGDPHFSDLSIPPHRAPARYSIEATGFRKAAIKVVSLESWQPGVFPFCRTAKKIWPPKKAKENKNGITLECSIDLRGRGRHYVDLYVGSGIVLNGTAQGGDDVGLEEDTAEPLIVQVNDNLYGFEVNATSECYYDVHFGEDDDEQVLRINLTCDDAVVEGCRTEFERLIRINRANQKGGSPDVQIDRQSRSADLQSWILDKQNAPLSFYPLVIAPDYAKHWRPPTWAEATETIYSAGRFLSDPRPPVNTMVPPARFVEARVRLFEKIRGSEDTDLVEGAQLGGWLSTDADFAGHIEEYVSAYLAWLESDPNSAAWTDIILVASLDADGRTLQPDPDALIFSPLHPVKLAWHCLAQKTLYTASRSAPCPAASILDPNSVPDALVLPLNTARGSIKHQAFFSVECTSDYWGVLWNGSRLNDLGKRAQLGPFDQEFGVGVGGVSNGFSISQVQRALDDVSAMLVAKPVLNVLLASADTHHNACNDGVLAWCRGLFQTADGTDVSNSGLGRRLIQIFDDRRESARPVDAAISNMSEDTENTVRWFHKVHEDLKPDLGIIAQLETSSPSADVVELGSPVGTGGLLRHRLRTQLRASSGAFLTETRSGMAQAESGDILADKIRKAMIWLEQLGGERYGYTFAPSVHAIKHVLDTRNADFAAISSTAVDPACFLGGWLGDAYLWDYDLPSYSQRAGDTNGYYLLSNVKQVDRDTLRTVLARLPSCSALPDSTVDDLIFEVARRGIPTVRGLSAGDSGASGDLGLFLAARIIQDEFRASDGGPSSLLPVVRADDSGHTVALIIPVDPFAGYLDDLRSATKGEPSLRPDLIVATFTIANSGVDCRLTPVEVKYRGGIVMSQAQCNEALQQATALSKLLERIRERGSQPDLILWRLAFQHLLVSMVSFAFRVYSQQRTATAQSLAWAALHHQVITSIIAHEIKIDIDTRGRLLVFDKSASGGLRDFDNDGFFETLVIGSAEAAEIAVGDPSSLYAIIRNQVGSWELDPMTRVNPPGAATDVKSPLSDPLSGSVAPTYYVQDSLVERVATMPEAGGVSPAAEAAITPIPTPQITGVNIHIGSTVGNFRDHECYVNLSDTRLNQLNIGVVGDLGTGKTQLLKSLIYQISSAREANGGITPRFLIFDYKKDYSSKEFVDAVGARVIQPHNLPLNLFDISGMTDSNVPWLDRFKFFADVLDKIFSGIGPVQRQQLKVAVRQAYDDCESLGRQPTIYDVHEKYKASLGNKSDAPLSIIDDMVDSEMFARDPGASVSIDSFLDGVVVISLASLGQDDRSKNMLVAIMLNMFYEHMLRIPKRPFVGSAPSLRSIDSFLMVDEADNIMKYEFPVLQKILLECREFGVGVVLASQYLRHFRAGTTNYLEPLFTWLIHKVPSVTPQELTALGITSDVADLAGRIRELPIHQCMLKTYGVPGTIVMGLPFYKLVKNPP